MYSLIEVETNDIRHSKGTQYPEVLIVFEGKVTERVTGPTAKIMARKRIKELSFNDATNENYDVLFSNDCTA